MEWEKIAEKVGDLVLGQIKEVVQDLIFRVERLETKMAA